jgi:hypothetical protein
LLVFSLRQLADSTMKSLLCRAVALPWLNRWSRDVVATRRRRQAQAPNPLEPLELRCLLSATPTPAEQETLELINRLRTNPQGELNRLFSNLSPLTGRDANVNSAVQFFGVNGRTLESQWQSLVAVPPVAWNEQLASAAETHNNLMVTNQSQSHQFPGEAALLNRVVAAGYANATTVGENLFAYSESPLYGHAGLAIDWGDDDSNSANGYGTGIQSPPGHRNNLMSGQFREVGLSIIDGIPNSSAVGPQSLTQDFGSRTGIGNAFLLGVVFGDSNTNGAFNADEGVSGATITASGPAGTYSTTTWSSGGYQLQIPPGLYTVTVSGTSPAFSQSVTNVSIGGDNVKIDFNTASTNSLLVEVARSRFNENEGPVISGTVTRTGNLTQALTVSLISSTPAAAGVPTNVTIPPGALSANFTITSGTVDTASASATISASAAATAGGSTTVTVVNLDGPENSRIVRWYRAYNRAADYHFYTTNSLEFDATVRAGYVNESSGQTGFAVLDRQVTGGTPVYRLYNLQSGRHYYTINAAERDFLVALVPPPPSGQPDTRTTGWRSEGSEGYMFATQVAGTQPVYKLYNQNSGVHVYTINRAERDAILATYPTIFAEHTLLGYAYPVDSDNIVIGAINQASVASALAAAAIPSAENSVSTATPDRTPAAPAVILSRIAAPGKSPAADPALTLKAVSDVQTIAPRFPAEPSAASIPLIVTDAVFAGGLSDDFLDF